MLTLSLIIPVYNEERHIVACLEAIAAQTVMPDEVLVIDNNCTDETIKLTRNFSFVTIIKEKKQGRAYARNAGFNQAKSTVLGRIDADSRLEPTWCEQVKQHFEADPELDALTGVALTATIPYLSVLKTTFWSRSYFWFVHVGFKTITMWGANMAVRRTAWDAVSETVITDDSLVHEDQDLSIWIAALGGNIMQSNSVRIVTDEQSYRVLPKLLQYIRLFVSTKRVHTQNGNLSSPLLPRLGSGAIIAATLASLITTSIILVGSTLLYPVDWLIKQLKNY